MNTPDIIYNVSQTQFSIAKHYGGIEFNGSKYLYNHKDDTLVKVKTNKKQKPPKPFTEFI